MAVSNSVVLPRLQFFNSKEAQILEALTVNMVGLDGTTQVTDPVVTIDAFVTKLPSTVQRQLRQALHLFQWCPILFIANPRFFTRLSPYDATAYIQTWAESRFGLRRRLFRGLRDLVFLGYYSQRK